MSDFEQHCITNTICKTDKFYTSQIYIIYTLLRKIPKDEYRVIQRIMKKLSVDYKGFNESIILILSSMKKEMCLYHVVNKEFEYIDLIFQELELQLDLANVNIKKVKKSKKDNQSVDSKSKILNYERNFVLFFLRNSELLFKELTIIMTQIIFMNSNNYYNISENIEFYYEPIICSLVLKKESFIIFKAIYCDKIKIFLQIPYDFIALQRIIKLSNSNSKNDAIKDSFQSEFYCMYDVKNCLIVSKMKEKLLEYKNSKEFVEITCMNTINNKKYTEISYDVALFLTSHNDSKFNEYISCFKKNCELIYQEIFEHLLMHKIIRNDKIRIFKQ